MKDQEWAYRGGRGGDPLMNEITAAKHAYNAANAQLSNADKAMRFARAAATEAQIAKGKRSPEHLRALSALDVAQGDHQEAQRQFGAARRRLEEATEEYKERQKEKFKGKQLTNFLYLFREKAREMLDPDVFRAIEHEATLEKNRDVIRYEGGSKIAGRAVSTKNAQFSR